MKQWLNRQPGWWLPILLGLALLRGLIYLALIPPWQSPDETGHFEYAWLIAHLGRLPRAQDTSPAFEQQLIASLYAWRYGELIGRPLSVEIPSQMDDLPPGIFARHCRTVRMGRFSLAYVWQAMFVLPVRAYSLVTQLYMARLSSILLNVVIVGLIWAILGELFPPHSAVRVLPAIVLVFMPQHTFINSMVGEGPLAEVLVAVVVYGWVCSFRRRMTPWLVAAIVAGTVGGILTKATAVFLIPLDLLLAAWYWLRLGYRPWHRHTARFWVIGLALLALLVGVLWLSPLRLRVQARLTQIWSPASWTWQDANGLSLGEGLLLTHDSFWAKFGWLSVSVSDRWYGAVAAVSVIALAGWLVRCDRQCAVSGWNCGIIGVSLGLALLGFVFEGLLFQPTYWIQGRYLFSVAIPHAILWTGGLARFSSRLSVLGVILVVFFDVWCLAGYILGYFYG